MGPKVARIDVRRVAAKYAMRRTKTLKKVYDDAAAQKELLRIMEDSAQSRHRANKMLGVEQ